MKLCIYLLKTLGGGRGFLRAAGVLCLFVNCAAGQDIDPASGDVQPYTGTAVNGYELVWSDEFNTSFLDTDKWVYREGDDSRTYIQSYQQAANNSVSNGLYRVLLKKESQGTKEYTAGGIISKQAFRYGYYESRMKVPAGGGWHSSFWMMKKSGGVAPHIELDVIENDSVDPSDYNVNIHRHLPEEQAFGTLRVETPPLSAGFHVFGCEFTADEVRYFFDGTLVQTVDAAQFDHNDMNIWLTSLALVYDGQDPVDDSLLPAEAQYDYVRFFELAPHAEVEIVSPDSGGVTLADTHQALHVSAAVTHSTNGLTSVISWSKLAGPGDVWFEDSSASITTAQFSEEGFYTIQCAAAVGQVTNTAAVDVAVNAELTVSLQHGVSGYESPCTFIREDNPDLNSGARSQIIIGRTGGGLRALFSFDLAGRLDPRAVIQRAELDLWTVGGTGQVGDLELHRLASSFAEGTGDGFSELSGVGSGATWRSRTGELSWDTAGGDFDAALLSSVPGYDATIEGLQKSFGTSSDFTGSVQTALNGGQTLNLAVYSPSAERSGSSAYSRIHSDDSTQASLRPKLTLTFMGNNLPWVSPGEGFSTRVDLPVSISGSVSNQLSEVWSKRSGPGTVTFADAGQRATTVCFSEPGVYVLGLSASNELGVVSRDVTAQVASAFPQFVDTFFTGASVDFQVHCTTGLSYILQTSTNLQNWTDLFTIHADESPMFVTADTATNVPVCFYRLQLGP